MAKRTTQHGARRTRQAQRAQTTNAGPGSGLRPEFAIFMWLLDPRQRDAMRRRFMDNKGGALERWVWKFAYRKPPAPEEGIVGIMRFMTMDQVVRGEGNKPGPKYLNLPPGAVDRSGREHAGARLSWEALALRLHQAAWALIQDRQYVEALYRRIDDSKALAMERLLGEIVDQNARKPDAWRPRRSAVFVSEVPPWLMDPLAERERSMIAAQEAQEAEEVRAREAARAHAAAAAAPPDDPPGLDVPELVRLPEP